MNQRDWHGSANGSPNLRLSFTTGKISEDVIRVWYLLNSVNLVVVNHCKTAVQEQTYIILLAGMSPCHGSRHDPDKSRQILSLKRILQSMPTLHRKWSWTMHRNENFWILNFLFWIWDKLSFQSKHLKCGLLVNNFSQPECCTMCLFLLSLRQMIFLFWTLSGRLERKWSCLRLYLTMDMEIGY